MNSPSELKVLSCVPKQRFSLNDKLGWIANTIKVYKPDLLVTPQEYFGGMQKEFFSTDEPYWYSEDDVVNPVTAIAKTFGTGIIFGALIKDSYLGEVRERVYGIDPVKGRVGHFDKIHLPAYDHVEAGGVTRVFPEPDLQTRSVPMEIMGARVSILFCWEVFSSFVWNAIARGNPDFVVSPIKFGICGWPRKGKDKETGRSTVDGFGFGDDGGWLRRLEMASLYDVAAPIVCSTNSWNLPTRAKALCGTIYPWEPSTIKTPTDHEDLISIDTIDPMYWRYIRGDKHTFFEHLGKWPEADVRKFTMMWKIRRMERKLKPIPDEESGGPEHLAKHRGM